MNRLASFRHAIRGVFRVVQTQPNARIHLAFTVVVVGVSILFQLSTMEWCWIVLAISLVWTAEAFNSALEFLSDVVSPEFHPMIRDVKDIAAGAVLISAIGAAVIGMLVFVPQLIHAIGL